jgi:hypothetical protein
VADGELLPLKISTSSHDVAGDEGGDGKTPGFFYHAMVAVGVVLRPGCDSCFAKALASACVRLVPGSPGSLGTTATTRSGPASGRPHVELCCVPIDTVATQYDLGSLGQIESSPTHRWYVRHFGVSSSSLPDTEKKHTYH